METIISGLETEFALVLRPKSKNKKVARKANLQFPSGVFLRLLADSGYIAVCQSKPAKEEFWLENGGRIYEDCGYVEYSTPECKDISSLLIHDKAGEQILEDIRRLMETQYGDDLKIMVFKNNVDSQGHSCGCHENYLVSRGITSLTSSGRELLNRLIPFFITRNIYVGAGDILINDESRELGFCLSQRAPFILSKFSPSARAERGIITDKSCEIHADENKFNRLHVVCGDSNMSDISNFLKVGTTHLLLRALEEHSPGAIEKCKLLLGGSVKRAIKRVSQDPSLTAKISLVSRGKWTALEIQEQYLNEMLRIFQRDKDGVSKVILEIWAKTLDCLRRKDFETLSRRLDLFIKLKLIEECLKRHRIWWDDPQRKIFKIDSRKKEELVKKIRLMNLFYHSTDLNNSCYLKLRKSGLVDTLVSQEEIDKAKSCPTPTRAEIRSLYIRSINSIKKIKCSVDWGKIEQERPFKFKLDFPSPFCSRSRNLEKEIRKLK